MGALDVRVNFFIRPAAIDDLVRWVGRGQVAMVKPGALHDAVALCPTHTLSTLCHNIYIVLAGRWTSAGWEIHNYCTA